MSDFVMALSEVMRAEIATLDSIAQNSANVNTPGYKSQRNVLNAAGFNMLLNLDNQNSLTENSIVNSKSGSLNVTENPFHIAIVGDGWFGVSVGEDQFFTRNGQLKLNDQMQIVMENGGVLLGENGPIVTDGAAFGVNSRGEVIINGETVDRIASFELVNERMIRSEGNGLYRYEGVADETNSSTFLQGALETSNVDSGSDMVRLMEVTRHIESLQRAILSYDSIIDAAINDLGN